ncbi:hypothetical protein MTO96_023772 [Rhipicephalus appendiculatus]
MECGRKKRMVLWAQATHLINECDQGWQVSLTVNEAGVLHTWWTSIRTELDTVNNEIDTLVSEDHLEEDYTQVIEYNDRIVQCLARLEQRTNAGLKQASPAPTAQAQPAHKVNGEVTQTTSQKMNVKLPKLKLVKFSQTGSGQHRSTSHS